MERYCIATAKGKTRIDSVLSAELDFLKYVQASSKMHSDYLCTLVSVNNPSNIAIFFSINKLVKNDLLLAYAKNKYPENHSININSHVSRN